MISLASHCLLYSDNMKEKLKIVTRQSVKQYGPTFSISKFFTGQSKYS